MTEVAPPDVKRRRLSAADGPHQVNRHLTDLPSGILSHTASFLGDPFIKVFLAIALDENSAVLPERSSAIIGNHQWDTLNFGQIEKDLAAKLSDLDIERVLLCIDAVNKLKRLKLTNCTNITGTGLEPLRGSVVIEQIDLSLVGYKKYRGRDSDTAPSISLDHVLPILDSIIAREGCALKHLHFPSVWRKEPTKDSEFHAFIKRYNRMYRNRGAVNCLECNTSPQRNRAKWIGTATSGNNYGIHFHTCYGCLEHFCYSCNIDGVKKTTMLDCVICKRDYCKECMGMTECSGCDRNICHDCHEGYECDMCCDEEFCSECVQESKSVRKCDYCDKCYCRLCNDHSCCAVYDDGCERELEIYTCSRCNVKCCKCCRLQRYQQGQLHCAECIEQSVATDESLARKTQQKELDVKEEELMRHVEELVLLMTMS